MARSKKAKQWTGVLAEQIDAWSFLEKAYPTDTPEFEQWCDRKHDRLHRLRIEKMPELARQVGMQVDKFDLTTTGGLMVFYGQLSLNLALKLEIPGFLEIKQMWRRQMAYWALKDGDARKARGERDPDLTACLILVRALDRDLARKDRKREAIQRAKTLRNEVSKLRRKIKGRAEILIDEIFKLRDAQPPKIIKLHKTKPVIS